MKRLIGEISTDMSISLKKTTTTQCCALKLINKQMIFYRTHMETNFEEQQHNICCPNTNTDLEIEDKDINMVHT